MSKGFSDMRGVSQATNCDTGQAVKIGFTVAIGQVGASAADKVHGHTSVCIHNMVLHDFLFQLLQQGACATLRLYRLPKVEIPRRSIPSEIEQQSVHRSRRA